MKVGKGLVPEERLKRRKCLRGKGNKGKWRGYCIREGNQEKLWKIKKRKIRELWRRGKKYEDILGRGKR